VRSDVISNNENERIAAIEKRTVNNILCGRDAKTRQLNLATQITAYYRDSGIAIPNTGKVDPKDSIVSPYHGADDTGNIDNLDCAAAEIALDTAKITMATSTVPGYIVTWNHVSQSFDD
jgi:hypothetical protein